MVAEQPPLLYRIEMWDDHDAHVEELIALVTDQPLTAPVTRATLPSSFMGEAPQLLR